MKLDYFENHKYKPRKVWWDFVMDKQQWGEWMKQLTASPALVSEAFASHQFNERELQKHAVIEQVSFDAAHYLATGEILADVPSLLVAVYAHSEVEQKQTAFTYGIALDKLAVVK